MLRNRGLMMRRAVSREAPHDIERGARLLAVGDDHGLDLDVADRVEPLQCHDDRVRGHLQCHGRDVDPNDNSRRKAVARTERLQSCPPGAAPEVATRYLPMCMTSLRRLQPT